MPAEPSRAIFLSYASQDAEAARRICDTLRAEGVEVWFDADGGLEHGDEWDQKIRRQIKECVLFLPIISANTQAREEGYFRLEWDLAAERARTIASGVPFILPVVIDETRESDALVPDRFRMVQWTKLPGGVLTPEVKTRYLKLWSHRTGALKHAAGVAQASSPAISTDAGGTHALPQVGRRVPAAAWLGGGVVVVAALVGFVALRPKPPTHETPAASAPLTKAQQQVTQARALYEPWDFASADDFKLAERLLKEATELEPTNAEAWAALAIVSYGQYAFGFDRNDARDELLRRAADRAGKLAPESDRAKLALALHYRRSPGNDDEAWGLLRELAERHPTDKFILRQLGSVLGAKGRHDEALAAYDRANALPGGDPIACMSRASKLMDLLRLDEAEPAIEQALALRPDYWLAHVFKAALLLQYRGDIEQTKAALQRIPTRVMADERVAAVAAYFWYILRDADRAGNALRYVTRDYVESNIFYGTKAELSGSVHRFAGRNDAAVAEWRVALRILEQRLVANPNASGILGEKSLVHALLGERAAAEDALRTFEQLRRRPTGHANASTWIVYTELGREAEVADFFAARLKGKPNDLPRYYAALLRVHPALDRFRGQPRFQALVADAEALLNQPAPRAGLTGTAPKPDEKSVAVLPFENKSDDKANEFFSDGIAEELGTLLGKIPGLSVTARASAFSFKGKIATVPEIGRELRVAHVVEGSVQKIGNTVKISASLSRTETGEQEWSDIYVKELKDVFAVQSEIAQTIVGRVRGQLGAAAKAEIAAQVMAAHRGGTKNPEAFQLYLKGKFHYARGSSADVAQSITFYEQAIATDRAFAAAWAAVARARVWQGSFEPLVTERFRQARAAADQALALEPNLAEAHSVMSQVLQRHFFEWSQARAASDRAVQLAPDDAEVLTDACIVGQTFGDWDRSIAAGRRAVSLDPVNPEPRLFLAITLFHSGRLSEAETEIRRACELAPGGVFLRLIACQILLEAGRAQEALAEAKQETGRMHLLEALALAEFANGRRSESDAALKALESEFADSCPFQIAEVYAARNDPTSAFKWLEHAWQVRDPGTAWVRVAATLKNLHADSRWLAFLKKAGLSDEQLK